MLTIETFPTLEIPLGVNMQSTAVWDTLAVEGWQEWKPYQHQGSDPPRPAQSPVCPVLHCG